MNSDLIGQQKTKTNLNKALEWAITEKNKMFNHKIKNLFFGKITESEKILLVKNRIP